MIRKTVYATAVVAFGLIVGGSAYAASAGESATATPRPVVQTTAPVDDNGGRLGRDRRVEPGDDRRTQGTRTAEPGDDRGGKRGGSDDRGSDDRGSDDRGGKRGGSDD
jgi:hypothetical protein